MIYFTILKRDIRLVIIIIHWSLWSSPRARRCRAAAKCQRFPIADINLWFFSLSSFLRLLQRDVVSVFVIVDLFALGQIAIEVCSFFADEN